MINLLAGPLAGMVKDAVTGFIETKKAKGTKCSLCWKITDKTCKRKICPQIP